jgi:hypothetical protein
MNFFRASSKIARRDECIFEKKFILFQETYGDFRTCVSRMAAVSASIVD